MGLSAERVIKHSVEDQSVTTVQASNISSGRKPHITLKMKPMAKDGGPKKARDPEENGANASAAKANLQPNIAMTMTKEEKEEREKFLMLTRVLMKYLEARDRGVHVQAKAVIKECYEKNKSGDPNFRSLTTSMRARLRSTVGEIYWEKANDFLDHFLKQKERGERNRKARERKRKNSMTRNGSPKKAGKSKKICAAAPSAEADPHPDNIALAQVNDLILQTDFAQLGNGDRQDPEQERKVTQSLPFMVNTLGLDRLEQSTLLTSSKGCSKVVETTDEAKSERYKDEMQNELSEYQTIANTLNVGQAFKFIDENRIMFRGKIWGPIAAEVQPENPQIASYLENHIARSTWKYFVVEYKEDYNILSSELRQRDIAAPIILVENGKLKPRGRMFSQERMNVLVMEHGFLGYLDEMFTAPDPVMEALVDRHNLDKVLVCGDDVSLNLEGLIEILFSRKAGDRHQGLRSSCSFYTHHKGVSFKYTNEVSRHTNKIGTSIDELGQAKILKPRIDPKTKDQLAADDEQKTHKKSVIETLPTNDNGFHPAKRQKDSVECLDVKRGALVANEDKKSAQAHNLYGNVSLRQANHTANKGYSPPFAVNTAGLDRLGQKTILTSNKGCSKVAETNLEVPIDQRKMPPELIVPAAAQAQKSNSKPTREVLPANDNSSHHAKCQLDSIGCLDDITGVLVAKEDEEPTQAINNLDGKDSISATTWAQSLHVDNQDPLIDADQEMNDNRQGSEQNVAAARDSGMPPPPVAAQGMEEQNVGSNAGSFNPIKQEDTDDEDFFESTYFCVVLDNKTTPFVFDLPRWQNHTFLNLRNEIEKMEDALKINYPWNFMLNEHTRVPPFREATWRVGRNEFGLLKHADGSWTNPHNISIKKAE